MTQLEIDLWHEFSRRPFSLRLFAHYAKMNITTLWRRQQNGKMTLSEYERCVYALKILR